MGTALFEFLPQELNGVEVRRIGRQLERGEPMSMIFKKLCGGFAGVIFGPILNQNNVLMSLLEDF